MKKTEKGEFGYLRYKKSLNLLIMIIAFVIVLAVFITGLIIFKNKNNYLTLVAILLVLPAAKFAVAYFILIPHKCCDTKTMNDIKEVSGSLNVSYDMVVSNAKKPIGVLAAVISDNQILAYTEETKADKELFETSVKEFMKNEKLNAAVLLYKDRESFLSKVKNTAANFDDTKETSLDRKGYLTEALLRMSL
ncbi:MAG: hypothetical protein PUB04_00335 [Clostridia bacterium]|nr:hypothetical protein [Clostridia bacterium]